MPKLCPVCGTSYPDALVFCPADATALRAADVQGDLVGSVVADRYLVTDLLGEGGMGRVYLARHVRLPQQAAIKVLRKELLRDASSVARFTREASNASRIDHDRVARVYDFGETDDGVVYLAMEFVHGRTLKAIIADGGPVAPERTAGIVRQIAEGLDAAHRMGIVHRDLKPENVMVIEDADGAERVKVVDFGIAKAFGSEEGGGPALTQAGYVVGTPEFMSPEQLLGGALDARSDIYALAIVAYQCLTGELPFDTNTPDRGLSARLTSSARTLQTVRPAMGWSPEVQAVFDQALAREPAQRPASAGAFARALSGAIERWQHGGSGETRMPSSASTQVPRPTPPVRADATPAPGTPARGRGVSSGVIVGGLVAALVVVGGGAYVMTRGRGAPADSSTPPTVAATTPPPAPATGAAPNAAPPTDTQPMTAGPTNTASTASAATTPPATTPPVNPPPATVPSAPRVGSASPTVPAPRRAGASADDAATAKRTLDSVRTALDPNRADEGTARAALPVLRAILPRLGNANDSSFAEVSTAEAYLLLGDAQHACAAYRRAQDAAPTPSRRQEIGRISAGYCQ